VADVTSLVQVFRERGVPRDNITLLSSADVAFQDRPTRGNVLAALQKVRRKAVAGDTVIFIFSGHGMEVDHQAYLLTVDSSRTAAHTALPLPLSTKPCRAESATVFVVDSCANDPLVEGGRRRRVAEPFAKGSRPKMTEESNRQAANIES